MSRAGTDAGPSSSSSSSWSSLALDLSSVAIGSLVSHSLYRVVPRAESLVTREWAEWANQVHDMLYRRQAHAQPQPHQQQQQQPRQHQQPAAPQPAPAPGPTNRNSTAPTVEHDHSADPEPNQAEDATETEAEFVYVHLARQMQRLTVHADQQVTPSPTPSPTPTPIPPQQQQVQEQEQEHKHMDSNTCSPSPCPSPSPSGVETAQKQNAFGACWNPCFAQRVYAYLLEHEWDIKCLDVEFTPRLSNSARKDVHAAAALIHGLEHESFGQRQQRHVVVSRPSLMIQHAQSGVILDRFISRSGSIYFEGPSVDAAAMSSLKSGRIPDKHRTNRETRDGVHHHITIIHSSHIAQMASTPPFQGVGPRDLLIRLLELLASRCRNDWINVGLGTIQQEREQAWFHVVEWPAATQFRKEYGLPMQHFHITVGFARNDIHDAVKDRTTLLPE